VGEAYLDIGEIGVFAMSTIAVMVVLVALGGVYGIAITCLVLGRPVSFKMALAWYKAEVSFSAGGREDRKPPTTLDIDRGPMINISPKPDVALPDANLDQPVLTGLKPAKRSRRQKVGQPLAS
jgi:hypothetical protein